MSDTKEFKITYMDGKEESIIGYKAKIGIKSRFITIETEYKDYSTTPTSFIIVPLKNVRLIDGNPIQVASNYNTG